MCFYEFRSPSQQVSHPMISYLLSVNSNRMLSWFQPNVLKNWQVLSGQSGSRRSKKAESYIDYILCTLKEKGRMMEIVLGSVCLIVCYLILCFGQSDALLLKGCRRGISKHDILNFPWQHLDIPPMRGWECQSNLCPSGTITKSSVNPFALKIGNATMQDGALISSSSQFNPAILSQLSSFAILSNSPNPSVKPLS